MAKKSAKSKGYRRQAAKKPYLTKKDIVVVCLIAALVAVGAFFLFRYDDGALKVQDGAVVADGDNWLIVNGSNTRGGVRYYKLGEIGEIDGYTREKGALATDANVPEYTFAPSDEGSGDVRVTVTTGRGGAAALADYTRSLLDGNKAVTPGEVQTVQLAGQDVRLYGYVTDTTAQTEGEGAATADEGEAPEAPTDAAAETAGAGSYSRSAVGYVDADHDCSVILQATSTGGAEADCLDDDALQSLLEKALEAVRLEAEN